MKASALLFCIWLVPLQVAWHPDVLKLPSCNAVYDQYHKLIFAGPRVRMGIHLASKGTYFKERNKLTKHVQFSGACRSSRRCRSGGCPPPTFATAPRLIHIEASRSEKQKTLVRHAHL